MLAVSFKAGKEDTDGAARMELLLARLREGGAGVPGPVERPAKVWQSPSFPPTLRQRERREIVTSGRQAALES
jgi:hypothetical protein